MKPKYVESIVCLICGGEAVGLDHSDNNGKTAVEWCANGHVVVISPVIKPDVQLAFDFSK